MDKIKTKEESKIHISTTQDNLLLGLNIVSRVSARNVNLPILQNVLLKASEGMLHLSATNLELAVSCLVRSKIGASGEITVPARLFAEYVHVLPQGEVDLTISGKTLQISAGKSQTKVQGIPASEFPVIPHIEGGKKYQIKIDTFRQAAGAVLFAAAQNEAARPELSGVFFRLNELGAGTLALAATDSYRLSEAVLSLEKDSEGEAGHVLVPAKTVMELVRILSVKSDGVEVVDTLTITIAENQVQFDIGNVELISRTIEGQYPDYRQIIPDKFRTEAVLSRNELTQAVKAASLFAKTGLYDVGLGLEPGKALVVSAADAQTGESQTEVACEAKGEANKAVVNYRYVLDGLSAIQSDEVVVKMIDGANPILIMPKDEAEHYTYIVMPIKQ